MHNTTNPGTRITQLIMRLSDSVERGDYTHEEAQSVLDTIRYVQAQKQTIGELTGAFLENMYPGRVRAMRIADSHDAQIIDKSCN